MKLSDVFTDFSTKILSEVDINQKKSNQHELGSNKLTRFLGTEKYKYIGDIMYLSDIDEECLTVKNLGLTWYDTRENNPKRSAEYRLYYQTNDIIKKAKAGDRLIISKTVRDTLFLLIIEQGSTIESQLTWLFNIDEFDAKYKNYRIDDKIKELGFAGKYILSAIGVEEEVKDDNLLSKTLELFNGNFPTTQLFSTYARSLCGNYKDYPSRDTALLEYLNQEEKLFRLLEKHLVSQKLVQGFGQEPNVDVDGFIKFSLSVQNRRKSRAGHAFENHIEYIFQQNKLGYSRGKITERKNKPDFIFPGIDEYKDQNFNTKRLTMLGAKTSAKDRWRQVLQEANRIDKKHLITLEPAISENQTSEMIEKQIQLVIPDQIQQTYTSTQRQNIITFDAFIDLALDRQRH